MDCMDEFEELERWMGGSLEEMARALGTIDNPAGQRMCASKIVTMYRKFHPEEAMNENEKETTWRLAMTLMEQRIEFLTQRMQELSDAWQDLYHSQQGGDYEA